jgi:hypothetical protein
MLTVSRSRILRQASTLGEITAQKIRLALFPMHDSLFRFDGLRRAIFEIQKAITRNVPCIVVRAPPGAGLTTLLHHVAGFDSMGEVPTRFFWQPNIGNWSADESVWLIQDAVSPDANNFTLAKLFQRQSPHGLQSHGEKSAVILLNPMTLPETLLYLSWRREVGMIAPPMKVIEVERLHRQCSGCIGTLTRQLTSESSRRAA